MRGQGINNRATIPPRTVNGLFPGHHGRYRIVDPEAAFLDEGCKGAAVEMRVDTQETADMGGDMRVRDSDRIRIASGNDRADDMPSPETAAHRIGMQPVFLVKTIGDGTVEQPQEMLATSRTESRCIERNDRLQIASIEPSQDKPGLDGGSRRGRERDSLALIDRALGNKAERDIKPTSFARGVQPKTIVTAIGHDPLHEPFGCTVGLQPG